MSALPPKADMLSVEIDVCFVPITDIPGGRKAALISFDWGFELRPGRWASI